MSNVSDNRAKFALATRMIDSFREIFGPDCKVVYAENAAGEAIGRERTDWLQWEIMPTHIDNTVPRSAAKGKR